MPRGKRNTPQAAKTPKAPRKPANGKKRPVHLLAVDRLTGLIEKIDKIGKRVAKWQIAGLNEYLRKSTLELSSAIGSLDSLPADFRPVLHTNGINVGDVILVKQKNVALYEALIGHPDTRLKVTAIQGAYLMCQAENDAKTAVAIPRRHTDFAPEDAAAAS